MNHRIQHEIDKTLDCLENGLDIPINPMFAQGLNHRMAGMHITQAPARSRRVSYPAVIVILLFLNLGAGFLGFKAKTWQSVSKVSDSPASVLAQEYGLGQQAQLSF